MIKYEDVLSLGFYKKSAFTGSFGDMCYQIRRNAPEDADACFVVSAWRGPYNYETTPDDQKQFMQFPFTNNGKNQAVDWLNLQYNSIKNIDER